MSDMSEPPRIVLDARLEEVIDTHFPPSPQQGSYNEEERAMMDDITAPRAHSLDDWGGQGLGEVLGGAAESQPSSSETVGRSVFDQNASVQQSVSGTGAGVTLSAAQRRRQAQELENFRKGREDRQDRREQRDNVRRTGNVRGNDGNRVAQDAPLPGNAGGGYDLSFLDATTGSGSEEDDDDEEDEEEETEDGGEGWAEETSAGVQQLQINTAFTNSLEAEGWDYEALAALDEGVVKDTEGVPDWLVGQFRCFTYDREKLISTPGGSLRTPKGGNKLIGHTAVQCTICLDEFKKGSTCICLPCSHLFHKDCLLPWFQKNTNCPYCRLHMVAVD
jgi:hypothetical protein